VNDFLEDFDSEINLLSEGTELTGEIRFKKNVRINGEYNGTIKVDPGYFLVVGEKACVKGSVEGDIILVKGYVDGKISATKRCTLNPTAVVLGDIKAGAIEILPGAKLQGKGITSSTDNP
jgi:cytoskeletal protein CcmA (bactofilin family)